MAYSETYCDFTNGSNVNAGDAKTNAQTTNGAYTRAGGAGGTDRFVAASGTPFAASVAGDLAAFMADGGTVVAFLARITTVNSSTSIDVSLTAVSGTRPATGVNGETCTVGGVWKGPNAAVKFPFGFITKALFNAAGDPPRVNLKNNATYTITAVAGHALPGPLVFQGYTTNPGDGGKAILDAGANAIQVLNFSAAADGCTIADIQAQNNSGATTGVSIGGGGFIVLRCIATNIGGSGFAFSAAAQANVPQQAIECEAYLCNQSDTTGLAGFTISNTSQAHFKRCTSHHNGLTSGKGNGFWFSTGAGNAYFKDCIASLNTASGFASSQAAPCVMWLDGCDAYNNTQDGVITGEAYVVIENCNFVKNGGYGIDGASLLIAPQTNQAIAGWIANNGFGSGSMANTLGQMIRTDYCLTTGNITYASGVTPWTDPDNGDFRINLAAAMNAGRGTFTETKPGYAGTVGYPWIGAAQQIPAAGGGLLKPGGMMGGFQRT